MLIHGFFSLYYSCCNQRVHNIIIVMTTTSLGALKNNILKEFLTKYEQYRAYSMMMFVPTLFYSVNTLWLSVSTSMTDTDIL